MKGLGKQKLEEKRLRKRRARENNEQEPDGARRIDSVIENELMKVRDTEHDRTTARRKFTASSARKFG